MAIKPFEEIEPIETKSFGEIPSGQPLQLPAIGQGTSIEQQVKQEFSLATEQGISLRQAGEVLQRKALYEDVIGAVKETPENLKIGTIMLGAGAFSAIKRRAMDLSGGRVLPERAVRHLYEAVPTTEMEPSRVGEFFFGKPGPLPGAIAAEAVGIVSRLPDVAARALRSKVEAEAKEQERVNWQTSPVMRGARSAIQGGIPSMIVAVGVGILTRSPIAALAFLGETSGGQEFEEQLSMGASLRQASIIADLNEAAEIGGEMLVLPKILRGATQGIPLKDALLVVAENTGQEGITGFAQQFLNTFGREMTSNTPLATAISIAFDEGFRAIPENAFVGGVAGGAGAAVAAGFYRAAGLKPPTVEAAPKKEPAKPTIAEKAPAPPTKTAQAIEKLVPKAPAAPPAAKEPWEMTKGEFLKAGWTARKSGRDWNIFSPAGQKTLLPYVRPEDRAKTPIGAVGTAKRALEELHRLRTQHAVREGKPVPRHVLEEYKSEKWAKKELAKVKYEFEVGDAIDTKGHSNMADPITIRAIQGNTIKFTDAEGVEYAGMARATVRQLIEGGSWKRVGALDKSEKWAQEALAEVKPAEVTPGAVPGGGLAWQTAVRQGLKQSKEIRPQIKLEQHEERARRAGAYEGTLKWLREKKGLSAKEALARAKAMFKTPLTEYQRFEGLDKFLPPETIENAYADIATTPLLRPYERAVAGDAFRKLEGGFVLAPHEAELLKKWQPSLADIIDQRTGKSPVYRMVTSLWRAGLLTGIKTSMLNTFSNFTHAMTEVIKDVPAAGVDSVVKLFTGKRAVGLTVRGSVAGFREGFEKGWEYLKTGYEERDIGIKYDYYKVNFGTSKFAKGLQAYEEFVFRLMGSEDQPFYYAAKARSLYNQAIAEGRNRKLRGAALQSFVNAKVQNPTDKMLNYATLDAETAVFQNKTALGDIGAAIQRAGGEIIVPFSRTPSAIAMQIINYTPVGAIKIIAQQIQKGQFNQRQFSQAMGRAITGTAAAFLGVALYTAGLMTLGYPDTERERKLWEIEGRKENSIKIGRKWRSVFVLGPIGNIFLIGGYFRRSLDETGSPTKAMATALAGGAKSFSEQTFVQGLSQAAQAIADPERSFERYFSSLAGSTVPTIVADIARATDTTERVTGGPLKRLKGRVPGLRETLEPRLDVFGQDLPRFGGNPLEVMVDPTRPVKIREDIVVDELRRLWDAEIRVAPTMLGDKAGYEILSDHENMLLWRRAGELTYRKLFDLIQRASYQHLSDEKKGKKIEEQVKEAKDLARAEAATAKVEAGEPLDNIMASDLVNQDVQKLMRRMRWKQKRR